MRTAKGREFDAQENRKRTRLPQMRPDNSGPICPDCGTREALESIGVDRAEQERILDTIHQHQRQTQRAAQ